MTENSGCYLLEPDDRIRGQMGSFIANLAGGNVVYVDKNILPYLSKSEMENTAKEVIRPILDFNSVLSNRVFGRSDETVVITRDVKDEICESLDTAISELGRVKWPKKPHEKLRRSYETLKGLVLGRQVPYENNPVFHACYEIAQRLLEHFPRLKKDQTRKKGTEAKLVAHAFAQAIQGKQQTAIFSNDDGVVGIAREMYKVLVAKDMGGDMQGCDLWTPSRAEYFIAVWGYGIKNDNGKKMYVERFAKKFFANGFKWEPPVSKYNAGKQKILRKHVWQEIAAIDEALGNAEEAGVFLDSITGTKKSDKKSRVPEGKGSRPAGRESKAPAKPEPKKSRTLVTQGSRKRERNLETVLFGLIPEDIDNLPQEKIESTIRRYKALKALARELKLPLDKINAEIHRIEGRSMPVMIQRLTEETTALVEEKNSLTADINYFKKPQKREKVEDIEAKIRENSQRLQELEQAAAKTTVARQTAGLNLKERELYEGLKKAGYDPDTPGGVLVPAKVIQTAGGYKSGASCGMKLKRLEEAGKIERVPTGKGRQKDVMVTLDVISRLVKGRN